MNKKYILSAILIFTAISMLAPFLIMVMVSLSPENQLSFTDVSGMVQHLTLSNYTHVTNTIPVGRYFINSLVVSVLTTIGQIVVSTLAGYAFARITFKGRNIIFFIILITMFIPPQVNIIPLFFLMRELHLVDTYPALILPGIFGGFGVFMMRQHFLSFPKELEDASIIDGCNKLQMFWKIACPLALPAITTLAIFTFISSWNSFVWPLIVTNSEAMRTLPLGLAVFKGSYREVIEWGDLLACSLICTLPAVIIFLLGKKYIINDMMKGGVKG
ncbi:MAG: carbohydrate ABC transporter permease [Cyanobacteria bacterium RUI128]|nr:carbohydrate ABC transporter permease [Cyanobacteria bacterium RUI128]